MSKILITGGHLTPALAFIDYCNEQKPDIDIIFAGRKYAQISNQQLSWEKLEIDKRKIKFIDFDSAKTGNLNPLLLIQSYQRAKEILQAEKIDRVLSFGGYLAVPFALAAAALKISLITHEQTRVFGRANKFISVWAHKVATSFPETKTPFPQKTEVTGNPLRQPLFNKEQNPPKWYLSHDSNLPMLYIAGGSQGSLTLNKNILPLLEQLTKKYIVIHQLGKASEKNQPLALVSNYMKKNEFIFCNYYPREFLDVKELAYFLPRVKMCVARAGANTAAELVAFNIPTLFIPLPFSNYDEQTQNAKALVDKQAALLLAQDELTPNRLLEKITELFGKRALLRENLKGIQSDGDANKKIYNLFDLE